eukprot:6640392-Prymnesium_polylepis.2
MLAGVQHAVVASALVVVEHRRRPAVAQLLRAVRIVLRTEGPAGAHVHEQHAQFGELVRGVVDLLVALGERLAQIAARR